MIRLALILTPSASAIPPGILDSPVFDVVSTCSTTSATQVIARTLGPRDPEVLLVDLSGSPDPVELVRRLRKVSSKAVLLGFGATFAEDKQALLEQEGLTGVLQEPFSALDLEGSVRWAMHQLRPVAHPNLIAFLPAKAGSGCSTTVLNTAAALANNLNKRTLLIEGDRRSGALSILLDVEAQGGLPFVLEESGKLSAVEWRQHVESIGKLDLLLANPLKPGPQPTWATYFHILGFTQNLYDFILVDLPELVNPATAELVNAARMVFIVCEPEITSLKLVRVRRAELEEAGVPTERIAVLANRWEPRRLTKEALETMTHTPMYAALPNDYLQVKNAAMESRLVAPASKFGKACDMLARRVGGGRQEAPEGPVANLLRRFAGE